MKAIHAALILPLIFAGCAKGSGEKENAMEEINIQQIKLDNLCITILYDNTAYFEELRADWGFACLIEGPEKTVLFDTGAKGDILMSNIESMSLDPVKVDVVVLSHQHWDHVGGLEAFLARNSNLTVLVLKSFPDEIKKTVDGAGAELTEVSGPYEICSGVYSTGTMGTGIEEQSLIITTDKGTLVITGCAHPGIVEIVKKAKELTGQEILLVMGGFHLMHHSDSQMKDIVDEFKELGVLYAGPCHCTGKDQLEAFRHAFEGRFLEIGAGREITAINFIHTH